MSIEAVPALVQSAQTLTLRLGPSEFNYFGYELGAIEDGASQTTDTVTLGDPDTTDNTPTVAGATPATNKATVDLDPTSAAANDGNRVDDTLTLTAYSEVNRRAAAPLEITLIDKHKLPKVTAILVDAQVWL